MRQSRQRGIAVFTFLLLSILPCAAQQVDPAVFAGLRWRLVGPFRGGRALTATGVSGQPNVFYFGSVGGGVWKSTDAGNTWEPIFDSQKIASIGAIAVAPSAPNVVYVGTGEADMRSQISYGDGMYKSSDAGKSWTHIGLEDSQQIGRILVDPHDPERVFVAVLGHAYAANSQRGVFRSTDGGKHWERVLYKDDNTGAIDLAFDPTNSQVIYAALWQTRRPPWNIYPASNGPGSGLYKSTDGGATWQQLTQGLPTEGLGRIGIAVAPSDPSRVYAIVDAKDGGLYRSDDAGRTWTRASNEARTWGRGWYFGVVEVDPRNPDVAYVCNTSMYKSVDGGKSFTAFKGAPGGDDYHGLWIAPEDPQRMIVSSDQGTIVTLNGGQTWSSWYNQPTAQLYHVATDRRFPYWIYGAQQDSGTIAVPSGTDYASITGHDWGPIALGESDMVAPDPLHPGIVFGGTVDRYDVTTSQGQDVSPTTGRPGPFRRTWTLPLVFSSADPHKLYFSHQFLFRSTNGGKSWEQISPDLTRENPGVPANLDPVTAGYGLAGPRKGVIYSIAPSPLNPNLLWVGTDDGLIHRSSDDGKHWSDVTPKELTAWSKVATLEASHFDEKIAYAAVDRHRLDDYQPYIYRTHDGGKTWQMVAKSIPAGSFVNVVREDPLRAGMLYAGTELGIYVSFNDGDDWQPLQLNLPAVSVRDITIHDSDLIIATHGRSFWVLDDIAPLRAVSAALAAEPVHLFQPVEAVRVRPGSDQGTPYPKEIPHGDNAPAGALLDYWLKDAPAAPVTLEILDAKGGVVRSFRSDDRVAPVNEKTLVITMDWVRPAAVLSAAPGMHRFVWDLHYEAPAPARGFGGFRRGGGPWVLPGEYTVRLTVDGKSYTKPLTVKLDPRVKVAPAELEAQLAAAQAAAAKIKELTPEAAKAAAMDKQLKDLAAKVKDNAALSSALAQFGRRLTAVLGPSPLNYGAPVIPLETDQTSLRHLLADYSQVLAAVESADAAPTAEQHSALRQGDDTFVGTMAEWKQLLGDLPGLNAQLKQAGLPEITTNPKP